MTEQAKPLFCAHYPVTVSPNTTAVAKLSKILPAKCESLTKRQDLKAR